MITEHLFGVKLLHLQLVHCLSVTFYTDRILQCSPRSMCIDLLDSGDPSISASQLQAPSTIPSLTCFSWRKIWNANILFLEERFVARFLGNFIGRNGEGLHLLLNLLEFPPPLMMIRAWARDFSFFLMLSKFSLPCSYSSASDWAAWINFPCC